MRPLPELRTRRESVTPSNTNKATKRLTNGFNHVITRSQVNKRKRVVAVKRSFKSKKEYKGNCTTTTTTTTKAKVEVIHKYDGEKTKRKFLLAEAEKRTINGRKKRPYKSSALWVLNCEAESFLEKSEVDKHENELSPLPKKTRRFRTTELGTLLNETNIIGSKLRNESNNGIDGIEEVYTLPNKNSNFVYFNNFKLHSPLNVHIDEDLVSSPPPTSLPDSYAQSDKIQNILTNMDYRFSFEDIPRHEAWYQTFSRQNSPKLFIPPKSNVLLPFETKGSYKRSQSKFSLSRKSPRCHPSTLAILSSTRALTRKNSSTNSSPTGPSSSRQASPSLSPTHLHQALSTTAAIPHTPSSQSTSSFHNFNIAKGTTTNYRKVSPTNTVLPTAPPSTAVSFAALSRSAEITATQYLWDSIQFLSDPYIVQTLIEEKNLMVGLGKHHSSPLSPGSRRSPSRSRSLTSSPITTALSEGTVMNMSNQGSNNINYTTTTNVNNNNKVDRSSSASPKPKENYRNNSISIPSSNHHIQNNNNNNLRKSPRPRKSPSDAEDHRKSPVVLVSDIFKNNKRKSDETCLFSGDGLPPLSFVL